MRTVLYAISALFLTSCLSDAPRNNPIDPENGTRLAGTVQRLYRNEAISGVIVKLSPGDHIAQSNANGYYQLEGVAIGEYILRGEADGFWPFEDTITVTGSGDFPFRMNALPEIRSISMFTRHEAEFFGQDRFFMEIEAFGADDDEADIDIMRYEIPSIAFADTMIRQTNTGDQVRFIAELNANTAGTLSLQELVGRSFVFYIEDIPGAVAGSADQFISRIIDITPEVVFPKDTTTNLPFRFEWEPAPVQFTFTYRIELLIESDLGLRTVIDSLVDISPDSTSISYDAQLDPGEYLWVLYVTDDFGNSSRSLFIPFSIQPFALSQREEH